MTLKVDVPQDRKMYSLQVRPYIFQPGNFTGRGSEGVKTTTITKHSRQPYHCLDERKYYTALKAAVNFPHVRAQKLCQSRGGRPGLPSLISLRFLWT